jgi:bifunctional enzyme CysN/CysC
MPAPQTSSEPDLLRLVLCGSVDDGKSTLLGRLLHDTGSVPEDQLAALARDSRRFGTQGEAPDLALLTDGLAAEREQGITIDVAYRFFGTARRRFIVADAPGHEQYTRNMVTGASTADAAVILVDAAKGVLTQTRRHSFLVALLGVRRLIVARQQDGRRSTGRRPPSPPSRRTTSSSPGGWAPCRRPPSRCRRSRATMSFGEARARPGMMGPPCWSCWRRFRPRTLPPAPPSACPCSGSAAPIPPSRLRRPGRLGRRSPRRSRARPALGPGERGGPGAGLRRRAGPRQAGRSVTLTLAQEIDVSRGDVLASADAAPEIADQFECALVWMGDEPMLPGRSYLLKIGARTVGATVSDLKHAIDVHSFDPVPAKTLALNEIGVCNLTTDAPDRLRPL